MRVLRFWLLHLLSGLEKERKWIPENRVDNNSFPKFWEQWADHIKKEWNSIPF